jgi:hypothetical protein
LLILIIYCISASCCIKVSLSLLYVKVSKSIAIRASGREVPYGCERLRLPHFLDNRLTDGGNVVSLTRRPRFTPQESSWYSFLLEAESTPGP